MKRMIGQQSTMKEDLIHNSFCITTVEFFCTASWYLVLH